jgi:lipid II:glycine glycyltransferase (peptidoglycan interpeptide bridge formation enzyme)
LRYESGSSGELLSCFYKLFVMTRRRHSIPPQPSSWFRTLLSCLGENATIRVAFKDRTPVAAILTISDKKTMVYKYGCSDVRYSNLGGTAMLFWNAIREARACGIEKLDMGRSDVDNLGLINYKEHWGAKRSTIHYWRYPACARASIPEKAMHRFKRLASIAPDWSLVMIGNALYKHIG